MDAARRADALEAFVRMSEAEHRMIKLASFWFFAALLFFGLSVVLASFLVLR